MTIEPEKSWTSREILINLVRDVGQLQELCDLLRSADHLGRLELDQLNAGLAKAGYWLKQGRKYAGRVEGIKGSGTVGSKQDDSSRMG